MTNNSHSSAYLEKQILFPMIKVPPKTSEVYETDPYKSVDSCSSNVEWLGLSPMEMVAQLSYLVNDGFDTNPNDAILPDIPHSSSSIPNDVTTLFEDTYPPNHLTMNIYNDENNKQGYSNESKYDSSSMLNKKRSRDTMELYETSNHEGKIIKCYTQKRTDLNSPWLFDFSEIQRNDNLISEHNELKSLTHVFESSPAYRYCYPSFERIQKYFCDEVVHLKKRHSNSEKSIKAIVWHNLLYATNQKMNALVHMARKVERNNERFATRIHLPPVSQHPNSDNKNMRLKGMKSRCKKNFTKYMTGWLKENWTNPYPDDNELVLLSRDCGMTPREVSNWLINARTRKWRPSIVKAYKLGKSAACLKEDAIRFFEGK